MQTSVHFARSRCDSPGFLSLQHPSLHQRVANAPSRRGRRWCGALAAKADQLLAEGDAKYAAGERVAALSCFEAALREDLSRQQRVAAAWNSACVHAYYGDVELAQISLKDALFGGLDYGAAMDGTQPGLVRLQASAQARLVQRQLKAFAKQVQRNIAASEAESAAPAAAPPPPRGVGALGGGGGKSEGSRFTEGLQTDTVGIDTSLFGMMRRVALLLLALGGLGAALFYLGLKYAFPESP